MSKIYDKPFKFGVLLNGLIFLFGNVVSYIPAIRNYSQCMERGGEFRTPSGCDLAGWGFPFVWNDKSYANFEEFSGILNIFVIFLSSIAIGFIFQFICSKIQQEN